MSQNMNGKVTIVTGGSSGIGRACAIEFAKAGAKVVVGARREAEGEQTVREIEAAGSQGIFVISLFISFLCALRALCGFFKSVIFYQNRSN